MSSIESAPEAARLAAARARTELAAALDQIEGKFDVRGRARELGERATELGGKAVASYRANPVPWLVAGAAVAVVAVGLVAWAILSDD